MKLAILDLWVLGLYFGLVLLLGFYFSRKKYQYRRVFCGRAVISRMGNRAEPGRYIDQFHHLPGISR